MTRWLEFPMPVAGAARAGQTRRPATPPHEGFHNRRSRNRLPNFNRACASGVQKKRFSFRFTVITPMKKLTSIAMSKALAQKHTCLSASAVRWWLRRGAPATPTAFLRFYQKKLKARRAPEAPRLTAETDAEFWARALNEG